MTGASGSTNGPLSWPEARERGFASSATKSQEIACRNSSANFFGGKSLLAHTRDRLQPVFRDENTFFVLNHAHRLYYSRELHDVPSSQKLVQPRASLSIVRRAFRLDGLRQPAKSDGRAPRSILIRQKPNVQRR